LLFLSCLPAVTCLLLPPLLLLLPAVPNMQYVPLPQKLGLAGWREECTTLNLLQSLLYCLPACLPRCSAQHAVCVTAHIASAAVLSNCPPAYRISMLLPSPTCLSASQCPTCSTCRCLRSWAWRGGVHHTQHGVFTAALPACLSYLTAVSLACLPACGPPLWPLLLENV
jgi:hypothetical protein